MNYTKSASPLQTSHNKAIAIFGGTFDPIHLGHLALAHAALEKLPCDEVHFLPCYLPVHRDPAQATAPQRREMIELAIAPYPALHLNDYELALQRPSYTFHTLQHLSALYPKLYFCMGMDAYAKLSTWFAWEKLQDYCQLVVFNRPGYTSPDLLPQIISLEMPPQAISATDIRQSTQIADRVPAAVLAYIKQHHLYQF